MEKWGKANDNTLRLKSPVQNGLYTMITVGSTFGHESGECKNENTCQMCTGLVSVITLVVTLFKCLIIMLYT